MRFNIKTLPFLSLFLFFNITLHAQMPAWLIKFLVDFLSNPTDPVFNITLSNEDFIPAYPERFIHVKTNFIPTFLPLTYGNLALKVKFLNERKYLPQIDIVGNYGEFFLMRVIPLEKTFEQKPITFGYSYGCIISKFVKYDLRIFSGLKYSRSSFYFKLRKPIEIGGTRHSEFDIKADDIFIVMGIQRLPPRKASLVASLSYGFKYKKLILRLAYTRKSGFEFGLDFFPESLIPVWPRIVLCF